MQTFMVIALRLITITGKGELNEIGTARIKLYYFFPCEYQIRTKNLL